MIPDVSSPISSAASSPSLSSSNSLQRGYGMTLGDMKIGDGLDHGPSSPSPNRSLSTEFHRALAMIRHGSLGKSDIRTHRKTIPDEPVSSSPQVGRHQVDPNESSTDDVGGPRFQSLTVVSQPEVTAGNSSVYSDTSVRLDSLVV